MILLGVKVPAAVRSMVPAAVVVEQLAVMVDLHPLR